MADEKQKERVPAVQGWFTMDMKEPNLIGSRCQACGSYFFPKETAFCRNPNCSGSNFEEVLLSRKGKLWSFVLNCYPPPAPYVSPDPFVPYANVVVELAKEKMMVMGQLSSTGDYNQLKMEMEMELVLEKLYEDEKKEYWVWKWRPVTGASR